MMKVEHAFVAFAQQHWHECHGDTETHLDGDVFKQRCQICQATIVTPVTEEELGVLLHALVANYIAQHPEEFR